MTAIVIPFPKHPVRVKPDGFGGWLVSWRKHGELHGSRTDALNEAWAIAIAHHVRIVIETTVAEGGAA